MRIAVLIPGHLRGWDFCRDNFINHLLDDDHQFDVYLETYYQQFRSDYALWNENQIGILLSEQDIKDKFAGINLVSLNVEPEQTGPPQIMQKRKMLKVYDTYKQSGIEYDLVFQYRPDLTLDFKLNYDVILKKCQNNPKLIFMANGSLNMPGQNAFCGLSTPENMDIYFNRLNEYPDSDPMLFHTSYDYIKQKYNVQYNEDTLHIAVVRPDGNGNLRKDKSGFGYSVYSRPTDVVTDLPLKPFFTFKRFPIISSCVTTEREDDKFADMNWGVTDAGTVALIDLLEPDLIYSDYHTTGIVGETWNKHHTKFKNQITSPSMGRVLEIGGSSGSLFSTFEQPVDWTIIEPNSSATPPQGAKFINGYFETHQFGNKFDVIVHSHCFEHSYNPIAFLTKVNELLVDGGAHHIAIPNSKYWLQNCFTNTLSFEHTFYCDYDILVYLLNKTGFTVESCVIEPHSIFVKAIKQATPATMPDFTYIRDLFQTYTDTLQADTKSLIDTIGDSKFYLFGAHIFAQILINLGLPEKQIVCILDNDPNKQGKRLYGTGLYVNSPSVVGDNDIVVVRAGSYTDEIKKSLSQMNPTVTIL